MVAFGRKYTEALDSVKYLKWHHDVGFMIGCSYLNGYRFADKKEYKDVIVEAANHCLPVSVREQALSSHGMPIKAGREHADGNVR